MKILTAKQIQALDKYTIENEPIASIDLMERAAAVCYDWLINKYGASHSFKIFCGLGNNGGDGLAIARMLHNSGCKVSTYIIRLSENTYSDFQQNESRLKTLKDAVVIDVRSLKDIQPISENEILIDALFGTGLSKHVEGLASDLIKLLNDSKARIISIDLPSGLFADKSSVNSKNQIVKATYTLSFQLYKLAFLFPENSEYVGEIVILPIGLNEHFIKLSETNFILTVQDEIKNIIKTRKTFSHKGNYGHAAIVAGSYGKIGAAVLASKACLKTGAGLLTTIIPACGYEIIQTTVPEAMVVCDENKKNISTSFKTDSFSALGIGPGIGTSNATANALKQIIQNYRKPMVIDADAINIIGENKSWLDFIPEGSIFTPHPKEFERLAGASDNDFERNKLQIEFAKRYNVFIVLKGRYTSIACPDGVSYFNATGNPGMAKGGSGDTLTGMITGLFAQGYSSKDACIAGVYLHGLAGDIAVQVTGEYSLLASDIIDNIGEAILQLRMDNRQ